jgi:glycerophosphoryl diester phosphodiesterase
VDEPVDFDKVMKAGVDGIFTNRAAELLKFYKRWPSSSVQDLLNDHKY